MHLIALVFFLVAAPAFAEADCHDQTPCFVGERSYHVLEPDGWDGVTPLPVLLHFHGWQRQGTLIVRHGRIASATRKRGVLLVAPNGARRTWDFWRKDTPDRPFAEAVLKDVKARWPIDEAQIYVSGYSWGSNMAWRFVCHSGDGIAALLAISGTLDQNEDCGTAPGEVRQVYGLDDQVLAFPFGPEGDTTWPVKLWRDKYDCGEATPEAPWSARDFLTFERTTWTCAGGDVSLDVHPGGHFIPHGWIARQLDELLGLPPSYP
ncbi:MAG: polyhydroxybutyrate depolymerase [Pseudomonadota bacterium]